MMTLGYADEPVDGRIDCWRPGLEARATALAS